MKLLRSTCLRGRDAEQTSIAGSPTEMVIPATSTCATRPSEISIPTISVIVFFYVYSLTAVTIVQDTAAGHGTNVRGRNDDRVRRDERHQR